MVSHRLLPLSAGIEAVERCYVCGDFSTGDLFGRAGWTLRQVSSTRLVDVCPRCAPPKRSVIRERQP